MDPRGLRMSLSGAACSGCGAAIPADGIAVLADRGDLAFVELSCRACGSRTLGVVLLGPEPADAVLDVAGHPELGPAAEARLAGQPPVSRDDVAAMHDFLERWEGDLRTLLDPRSPGDREAGSGG